MRQRYSPPDGWVGEHFPAGGAGCVVASPVLGGLLSPCLLPAVRAQYHPAGRGWLSRHRRNLATQQGNRSMLQHFFKRKPLSMVHEEMKGENRLRRVLGPWSLTS